MATVLRFILLVLWVSCACGDKSKQSFGSHYYRPYAQTYKHNYPTYNHHYPTYQKSPCSAETPCYQRLLTYTRDAHPHSEPYPDAFIYHHKKAGFDKYAIIEEGKNAAKFFHHQYGVDVGYLPDEAYLAPNITLASGMRFSFATTVPPTGKKNLNVATYGDAVEFVNAQMSAAEWTLSFPADYYSNGAFKGHIPAGSGSIFGSYIFDACPEEPETATELLYYPCHSTLSREQKGRVVIKYRSRTFATPGLIDCDLVHQQWGQGHVIGAAVTTYDGVLHERAILTFPRSL